MNSYTVFVYVRPDGGHLIDTIEAMDATAAVLALRQRLQHTYSECEVVAVVRGQVQFEPVDATRVALAPHCGPPN